MNSLSSISADTELRESIIDTVYRCGLPKRFGFSPDDFKAVIETVDSLESVGKVHPGYEAIIKFIGRPTLKIMHGSFETPLSGVWAERLKAKRSVIESVIPSVGRIEVREHPSYDWLGTGWVIGDNLIVTNRHVAHEFAKNYGGSFRYRTNYRGREMRARIDFREEHGLPAQEEFAITNIRYIAGDEEPDVAFLEVAPTSVNGKGLGSPLNLHPQPIANGLDVGVISYPAEDGKRNPGPFTDKLFEGIYNVKRLSPGKAVISTDADWIIDHDAPTTGGSSGGVVFNIDTGEAVGLHFAGHFRRSNYAVSSHKLLEIMSSLNLS